jgi:hypothetical protein
MVWIDKDMALILSRLQTIAVTILTALSLYFFQFEPAWSKNSGQKIVQNVVSVECINLNQADAALFKVICGEFITRLETAYPAARFESSKGAGNTKLQVMIHNANQSNLSMQLIWKSQSDVVSKSNQLSISIMDRSLNANRRASLYYRLLSETPMPNID